MTGELTAQVILRNDFVINRKKRKIENLGLTFVSINLDKYPNWNQLLNGRGGRSLVIDVRAIRHPKKEYSYSEIAEKVYTPSLYTGPVVRPIPWFLLIPPPMPKLSFTALHRLNLTTGL